MFTVAIASLTLSGHNTTEADADTDLRTLSRRLNLPFADEIAARSGSGAQPSAWLLSQLERECGQLA